MTVKPLYPTTAPSLNLDFANTKTLDPRITFSRASTGTYVGADGLIKTAASNIARFDHDPATGESLGLLVEEARTNQLWPSEPNNATLRATAGGPGNAWFRYSSTINSVARNNVFGLEVFPSTVLDSQGYEFISANGWGGIGGGGTFSHSSPVGTLSFFVNPLTWDGTIYICKLAADGNGNTSGVLNFPLFNNGFYVGPSNNVKAIFADGTYWIHNIAWSSLGTFVASQFPVLMTITPGDGLKRFWAGGFQWEAGNFSTSYIPTTSSTVTRAADVASITGTNFSSWYNQGQGTWFASGGSYVAGQINTFFAEKTSNLGLQIFTNQAVWRVTQGGTTISQTAGTPVTTSPRAAFAYTENGTAIVAANGTLGTAAAVGAFTGTTDLLINRSPRGVAGDNWKGTIARLAYYPVRLPDAQLQALTS